jgi:8-oxo-dGTP pyrophosphatase MutT (NUDIX family)
VAEVVHAAGGIPWRRRDDGVVEVLLVHRPAYDDWTFPKGKRDGDETDEDTALREVFEETGLRTRLGSELDTVEYPDDRGRLKRVRYWAMTVESSTPRSPDHEVDATRWLPADEAEAALTYERDRSVLRLLREVAEMQ